MSLFISEAAGVASMLAVRGQFEEEGPDQPVLSIWGGPVPAGIEADVDAEDNLLLVEFPLIGTVFGDPYREGDTIVSTLLPIGGVLGISEGEATFFRMYDRNGVTVMQGTVGLAESGSDLTIDDVDVTVQKLITVEGLHLTLPLTEA
jgi:hypothetical protein